MGTYVRPDKAIRENIIVKMEEDRDAIEAAFSSSLIETSVDFIQDVPPVGGDVRIRMALKTMTPVAGSCCCMPPGIPGGALVDIKLGTPGGPSILTAPAAIDATPGVPVPLVFIPGVSVPAGTPICYILSDNGNPVFFPTMNVQWLAS
jgi:hypothetical protein